jgi:polyisoprenoid-binding protein YceI
MLQTSSFPTATFTLTRPIALPSPPTAGTIYSVPATGSFTIHGNTRTVSFSLQATEVGGRPAVKGSIPVQLGDYDIRQPSAGPVGSVHDADIELLIAFDRAG